MRILHLCLSNYYIDAMSYQENMLVREHVRQGHEVLVIASTENLSPAGKLFYMEAGAYSGGDGARVIRLDYKRIVPKFLRRKFRAYEGVIEAIAAFNPDRVLFHGLASFDLARVARYFRGRPEVRLFADTHTDGLTARDLLCRNGFCIAAFTGRLSSVACRRSKRFCVCRCRRWNLPKRSMAFPKASLSSILWAATFLMRRRGFRCGQQRAALWG